MLLLVILFAILKTGFSICMFLQNRFMEERSIPDKLRSSRLQMFFKIGVLETFTDFTGKHLCWSLFLIKLQAYACNFIKRRIQNKCFPVKFAKFLKTPFLQNSSGSCFHKLKDRKKAPF